ncbi:hypothetical protein SS50377_27023 [Spironucleus salmonicida]|uniref:Uncharacterized protein n=1 Tax=Spironucleus salmonicida TaxID=348837 RepID=V6LTF2_9EUKA|nr:hypothetical protein SS50377_27023 [Spironucleus salmonicida]|eukprot:EST47533.1 Hypothetical protein SS50377_12517 [Spironucleus salmonicida]
MQFSIYTKKFISDLAEIAVLTQEFPQYGYLIDEIMQIQGQLQQNELSLQAGNKPILLHKTDFNLVEPTMLVDGNPFLTGGNLQIHDPLDDISDDI